MGRNGNLFLGQTQHYVIMCHQQKKGKEWG